jgi:hypothetical protein
VKGFDPEHGTIIGPGKIKPWPCGQGFESLNAVITERLLLREEKQGTTALRLSFIGNSSRRLVFYYRI